MAAVKMRLGLGSSCFTQEITQHIYLQSVTLSQHSY